LVDSDDRLENLAQIRTLEAAGYKGPYSFEPFAAEVHELKDPAAAVRDSIDHISQAL
jgi:2-keto-myo-inositol isomerase